MAFVFWKRITFSFHFPRHPEFLAATWQRAASDGEGLAEGNQEGKKFRHTFQTYPLPFLILKPHAAAMQRLSVQQGNVTPIAQIPDQGMPKVGQVHSDLMGAAGCQPDPQFGQPAFIAPGAVMSDRPLAIGVNLP